MLGISIFNTNKRDKSVSEKSTQLIITKENIVNKWK